MPSVAAALPTVFSRPMHPLVRVMKRLWSWLLSSSMAQYTDGVGRWAIAPKIMSKNAMPFW